MRWLRRLMEIKEIQVKIEEANQTNIALIRIGIYDILEILKGGVKDASEQERFYAD